MQFHKLGGLEKLMLEHNDMVYPPNEVIHQGCDRVRKWCYRRMHDRLLARQHTIVMAVQDVLKQVRTTFSGTFRAVVAAKAGVVVVVVVVAVAVAAAVVMVVVAVVFAVIGCCFASWYELFPGWLSFLSTVAAELTQSYSFELPRTTTNEQGCGERAGGPFVLRAGC